MKPGDSCGRAPSGSRAMQRGVAILALTTLVLPVYGVEGANSPVKIEPDEQVVYRTIGETELRMHIFRPPGHKAVDGRPCIVFFFGGGWTGGSPEQFFPQCAYFASRGMVAASAEYRVKSRHGVTPFECVADGRAAVRWLRANAASLGIDPQRIAAGGGSAGGHVAAAAALIDCFDDSDQGTTVSARPDALVLFNPVFDNGPGGYGHERVKERWRDFSPMHNIRAGTPPTIVFLGAQDSLIPVETAREYHRRMTEEKARCEVFVYAGQPHGFFNYRDGDNPYYSATVFEADRFLASLGYLEGAPLVEPRDVEIEVIR